MSTLLNLILLVIVGFAGFFVFKKMRGHPKPEHIVPEDPESQAKYEAAKTNPKDDEEKSLTMEERIELSWQFLIDITDRVLNHFSAGDRQKVNEAGDKLNKNGMKYQHNIDQEAKVTLQAVRSRSQAQQKKQGQGVAR